MWLLSATEDNSQDLLTLNMHTQAFDHRLREMYVVSMVKSNRKDDGIEDYRLFWTGELPGLVQKATKDFKRLQEFLERSVEFCDEGTRSQIAAEAKLCAQ